MAKLKKKPANNGKAAKSAPPKTNGGNGKAAKTPPKQVVKAPEKPDSKSQQQLELEGKLVHMIAEEMAIEEAELTSGASFKEDLNLDEIDVAELLMQTESQFGVHPFDESDWEACATVGEFLTLVSKRVEAKRSRKAGKA
ncbi:MAG: phosphopantetheine-binding protein [Terriglobales bacterium]